MRKKKEKEKYLKRIYFCHYKNIMKHKRSKPKKKSVKSKAINIGSKRKLDRFGKILQKGRTGSSAQFITRGQALKRLQISLKDFRYDLIVI